MEKETYHSLERHSLKSTASKLIMYLGTDKLLYSLWSTTAKAKSCLSQKGEKCSEIAKYISPWNHRECSLSTSMKNSLFRTINRYSFNFHGGLWNHPTSFVCGIHRAGNTSSFCDFWKITFSIFTAFFSFLAQASRCFRCA